MYFRIALTSLATLATLSTAADAEPGYRLDKKGERVIAISNLAQEGGMCLPDKIDGVVAARGFDEAGTRLTSVTLEHKNGERTFINVDLSTLDASDRITTGFVIQGLQQMTRKGRRVVLQANFCGAAGRVIELDGIISSK